jgi:CubicO group peptidase (beta-lactamase class C family)
MSSAALGLWLFLSAFAAEPLRPVAWSPLSTNGLRDFSPFLSPFQTRLELPALAAAVVRGKNVVAAGAVGERKAGSGIKVGLNDVFHIGSCTKSITALLAVELAANGEIELGIRVGEVFPSWKLDEEKRAITLEELLQNRSGISGTPPPELWARAFSLQGSPLEQRREFLRGVLAADLAAPPRAKYIYSNQGFALAGAMIEQRVGQPWEDLVRKRIFLPLGLASAGFGPPSTKDKVDNPWGHQRVGGKVTPIAPTDNPVAIAPAGLVHMSVLDIAQYAAFQRDVYNGGVAFLRNYRERMYRPPEGSDYAYGWIVQKRYWAGGTVLTHAGSNTMFYTVIWIAPVKGDVYVVTTNIGDQNGNETGEKCDQVVAALIKGI